jgi:lipopolysaccharide transport system ATP-binding protein
MSSEIAIKVENLSKCYQIYDQPHDRLKQFILPRLQGMVSQPSKQYFQEFWALKDISFDIKKGETVGIIGRNGSGKSTLLQMICGTLNPTGGSIQTQGRIAALLELGSSFNPEFTGRENIYLYASILGLNPEEIKSRFEEIIIFADIGEFIEQPIKTYSSGMTVRLAFAVAINVDPQILIVDEALSVGDERFQRKCFSKIESMQKSGITILFVSHSASVIVELCDRAILLDHGELLVSGVPKNVVASYHKLLYSSAQQRIGYRNAIKCEIDHLHSVTDITKVHKSIELDEQPIENYIDDLISQSIIEYESHGATISSTAIQTIDGRRVNSLVRGRRYKYTYEVFFAEKCRGVRFGMLIKTVTGYEFGGAATHPAGSIEGEVVEQDSCWKVTFEFACNLAPGTYFLNAGVVGFIGEEERYLHRIIDAEVFKVQPENGLKMTGIIDFQVSPEFERISN